MPVPAAAAGVLALGAELTALAMLPCRGWEDDSSRSGSVGLVALLLDAMLEKLRAEGEVKDADWRDPWFGRRGGGGAGAWMLTRRLEERDRVESTEERRAVSGSSPLGPTAVIVALGLAAIDALLSILA